MIIRIILATVDAEMGRGIAQVQVQTRSGTNGYSPLEDPETGKDLEALLPKYGGGLPVAVSPGTDAADFGVGVSNLYGGRGTLPFTNSSLAEPAPNAVISGSQLMAIAALIFRCR